MPEFKKSFTINEHFPHRITDRSARLGPAPVGNSTCHKTSCTLQGLRGQPGRAKLRRELVLRVIIYTFLTFPVSLKVTFLCVSFLVKTRKEFSGLLVSLSCARKGLWRINGRRKIYSKSLSLDITPSHSCPLNKLAFERTCRGIYCGREGEDG